MPTTNPESIAKLFDQFEMIAGAKAEANDVKRENANINADAPMGYMLKFGSEAAKVYNLENLIDPEIAELHRSGDLHIHDLDFYHTFNCVTPATNVIISENHFERRTSLAELAVGLGRGSHKIENKWILSRSGFTQLQYIHVREEDGFVLRFETTNRYLECTEEHVLPVIRDGQEIELPAKDIMSSDSLVVSHNRYSWEDVKQADTGRILKIEKRRYKGLVYDLTTEDHYFVANNIVSHNCCQIPLGKLLKHGFMTGHGFIRQPQTINSAAALACIAIQSNQNDMFGGQGIPMWDYDLAPYVARSFIKNCLSIAEILELKLADSFKEKTLDYYNNKGTLIFEVDYLRTLGVTDRCYELALKQTETDTHQAMQAVIHNLNTLASRCGSQTPFSSINYGTDVSPEGRLISKATMEETDKGLGHNETAIFPVQIFKFKHDINGEPGTPNYDLFKLACKTTAKRLFPNFSFMDSGYNKMYYKDGHPETEMAVMGCRTRVLANHFDPDNAVTPGRGNFAFCTLNLPRLAIKAQGSVPKFFESLDALLDKSIKCLKDRFDYIKNKKVYNFPFLMGQHVYLGSDELKPDDTVEQAIKHSTLSVGFIGLAEALTALTGHHHGEDATAQKLGLDIVHRIRQRMDAEEQASGLNWSCFATPAEGLSGRFVQLDKKLYGEIRGVTDKDYYTNSSHVPVGFKIPAFKKMEIEAPYHELCNGGHIGYVEVDGDLTKNVAAVEALVKHAAKLNINYFSINHPVDMCPVCHFTGVIGDKCPVCGFVEGEGVSLDELQERGIDLQACLS